MYGKQFNRSNTSRGRKEEGKGEEVVTNIFDVIPYRNLSSA